MVSLAEIGGRTRLVTAPKVDGAKRSASWRVVLRDLKLAAVADDPVLCDCEDSAPHRDCA
jgi:hypothetical protein